MIQALVPGIHRRPTGGNLFNHHVLAYLEGVTEVERRVVADGEALPEPRGDLTLVDSLLLAATDRPGVATGRCVLLAHYLQLFEPRLRESQEAARERRRLSPFGGVIATSRHCRDLLIADGLASERVVDVTPGLGPGFFAEPVPRRSELRGPEFDRPELDRPEPPESSPPRLLTVATILEGKGLHSLLGVLESLANLDWTWEVAGDPGLDPTFSDRFRRRLAGSPIARRVRLLGAVAPAGMIEVYDRAAIFVLPSRFESCSIATMEAMARGLPVVTYRVGGIPERVPSPNGDLLAPAGDSEGLRASLCRLLLDRGEAVALGNANRRAGLSFPTWEECGAAVWEFLQRIKAQIR